MSVDSDQKIMTIPNGLTFLRGLGIPLFLWLFLVKHNASLSFIVLTLGAITDYLDGKVARALNQVSKLGTLMDPAIDRAYIAATLISLGIRDYIPIWVVFLLIGRDVWLAVVLAIVKVRGGNVFVVTFLGKAATFNLLYAFPFLLLESETGIGKFAHIVGWSFAIWGIGLYLLTGILYSYQGLFSRNAEVKSKSLS